MAKLDKVSSLYAKSIYSAVRDEAKARTLVEELTAFSQLVAANKDLRDALSSARFSAEQKATITEDIATKAGASEVTRRTLRLLAENNRLANAGAIAEKIHLHVLEAAGIVPLQVVSAAALDKGTREKVESRFQKVLGKKVEASYHVDPNLLGGVRVTAAGRTYDGSLHGWLGAIEEKLVGGAI